MDEVNRILNRWEAAVRICYPEDMTPDAKRVMESIIEDERAKLLPGVEAPLRDTGWDEEDIALWMAAPHGSLGRRSPNEALNDGDRELVINVVKQVASGVW